MWWQAHWIELTTLVTLVGFFVRLESRLSRVEERQRDHSAVTEKRLDAHSARMSAIERDYNFVVNKCPAIRQARLDAEEGG